MVSRKGTRIKTATRERETKRTIDRASINQTKCQIERAGTWLQIQLASWFG